MASEEHLAWFILDAVEAMDISKFYLKYRADGCGRVAYDSQMMVCLLPGCALLTADRTGL
jgi:hypothetical protein